MANNKRVLIVEDEPVLRRVIARNLAAHGCEVREAATVAEAIEQLSAQTDLLLLDINLPDRTGWDVLRHLKHEGREVPTVIVSAVRISPERLAEFKPFGCLPKPFPIEALLRVVQDPSPTVEGQRLDDMTVTPREGPNGALAGTGFGPEYPEGKAARSWFSREATLMTDEAGIESILAASGVRTDLRVACATLVHTDPGLIRRITISIGNAQVDDAIDEAIRRYSEEQCLVAEVERSGSRLTIRLRRASDGDE